jgi:RNA polymerase sigma factor (sigma-70 family)
LHKNQHIHLTDEELLSHYQLQGEKEWLALLLQRYTLLLLGVAMKYLKDKHLAEDAVQQIFLKAFTHLPEGEIQNFKGWLYILMRNYCLQQLRNKSYFVPEEQVQHLQGDENERNDALEKERSLTYMHEALQELSADQRVSIELFYLKKQSYQQIMEQTGLNFMQVKSYIQNGKRNLKIILQKKQKGNGQ